MQKTLLQVESLGIRRSERWLFRQLSFTLSAGELVQVTGPNGAGKTSLLRSLCGLLPHAEGSIDWLESNEIPCLPLFLGHLPAVKPELTVFENLKHHPLGGRFLNEAEIEEAIDTVLLTDYFDTPARHLSAGQNRRVGLARLLLSQSPCWILDEPFTSLDLDGCLWLEALMLKFIEKGGAILMTTHQAMHTIKSPRQLALQFAGEPSC